MPGYIIHICVAKEYAKKHKVADENEFVEGTIYPDSIRPKGKTHYSPYDSSDTNLLNFLENKKLDSSYNEGYFLHLLADYLFYNKYFLAWKTIGADALYNDYDVLNQKLVSKYDINEVPDVVKPYFEIKKDGETVEYHFDKVVKFIEEVSNYNLHELAEQIVEKNDFKFLLK